MCGRLRSDRVTSESPRERRKERELFKEMRAEILQNCTKGIRLQIQQAEQNSDRINPRKFCTGHITVRLAEN